ncbi:retrovirus-related pol polyprotein from transposon TNT 1-94 [Tanacetum coccineum]
MKAQQKQPVLYCGSVLAEKHASISVIDTEETLELAKATRLKMNEKQNDPIVKEKRVNIIPIDYVSLNKLYKHFVSKKQLFAEQAFWLPISKTVSEQPTIQPKPIQNDIPRQLPTTSIHREVYEMKAIFQQMETEVEQCSVDKNYFKIKKKELLIENNRLLEQILSQDIVCIVMHSCDDLVKYVEMEQSYIDEYSRCLELKAELSKKKDMVEKAVYNELSNRFSRLKKGSRGTNLYTLSLDDMLKSSPICLLSKASKTKSCYYEDFGVTHQTSVTHTPQQNNAVKRQNRTLVEDARTMLIFSKAPLFLWAEAVATACYTQNRSLIRSHHKKTPYELLHDRKPDLKYFHVFGALCYPTNDSEDLGKLKPKADIGIFIGYSPAKKAYRIYNRWTRLIMETIHVEFDELTSMASKQFSSGPAPQFMTPRSISLELPSLSVVSRVPPAVALIPVDTTSTPSSTIIDQDAPSASTSPTT